MPNNNKQTIVSRLQQLQAVHADTFTSVSVCSNFVSLSFVDSAETFTFSNFDTMQINEEKLLCIERIFHNLNNTKGE